MVGATKIRIVSKESERPSPFDQRSRSGVEGLVGVYLVPTVMEDSVTLVDNSLTSTTFLSSIIFNFKYVVFQKQTHDKPTQEP